MRNNPALVAMIGAMALGGCVGSDTAVLFTTNNFGLNVQATPTPTAEISFSRQEGLIAPVFEDGNTVPTAASMRHYVIPFLPISTDSGTVFSGGRSAQDLATDLGDPTRRETVTCVSEAPRDANGNALPEKGQSRPMFFGTTTSIGFRVTMPAANAGTMLPNVHLGYRRNEMAVVPLMGEPDSVHCREPGRRYAIKSPEFLAVSANGTAAPTVSAGKDPSGGKFNVSQIFTTGRAAHAAAHIPAVGEAFRSAVGESTETATVGTVVTYDPQETSSQCVNKWLRDADDEISAAKQTELTNWMDSEKIGASPFVFVMGKEQSPNRAKFIAAKSIKCA